MSICGNVSYSYGNLYLHRIIGRSHLRFNIVCEIYDLMQFFNKILVFSEEGFGDKFHAIVCSGFSINSEALLEHLENKL